MSGGFIPYHLRHNKSIDREVFFEGLTKLGRIVNMADYTYIGFGGPMLEDFRHIHSRISINNLISLENDGKIYKRQLYNKPFNCINCNLINSTQFIQDYAFDVPTITWLDYASPKNPRDDLEDILVVSKKVSDKDILKITLPVNPSSYYQRGIGESLEQYIEGFHNALKTKLGNEYISYDLKINKKDVSGKNISVFLSHVLIDAIQLAIERGLTNRRDGLKFIPLVINKYNDGSHTMLTLFGVYRFSEYYRLTLEESGLNNWEFISKHWKDVQEISIPTLTIKEKINLDSSLPDHRKFFSSIDEISLDEKEGDNYLKYYRLYPNFQRVMV